MPEKFSEQDCMYVKGFVTRERNEVIRNIETSCFFRREIRNVSRCLIGIEQTHKLLVNPSVESYNKLANIVKTICLYYKESSQTCNQHIQSFETAFFIDLLQERYNCVKKEVNEVNIRIIAYNRPNSLSRLLESLRKAIYIKKIQVNLIIVVDALSPYRFVPHEKRKVNNDRINSTYYVAKNFVWTNGYKYVKQNKNWTGVQKQWINILKNDEKNTMMKKNGMTSTSINIVFEDDLAVSRFYLIYLLGTICTFRKLHVNNEIGLLSFHPQILASLTNKRAKAILCICPPEREFPLSPNLVLYLLGYSLIN